MTRHEPPTCHTSLHLARTDAPVIATENTPGVIELNFGGDRLSAPVTIFADVPALERMVDAIAEAFRLLDAEAVDCREEAARARLDPVCTAYGAPVGECGKPAGHDGLHGFGAL